MTSVTAFAPATVSNVACGFDVLGFALDHPGDEVTARFLSGNAHGVLIESIDGDNGRLPRDAARNTAGVAALALLTKLGERRGVGLSIRKGLPLSSGLGGSAASAAAAVVAVDALIGGAVDDRHADCVRARGRAARGGIGARGQHRAVHLRGIRAGPPPEPTRHPAGFLCRRV